MWNCVVTLLVAGLLASAGCGAERRDVGFGDGGARSRTDGGSPADGGSPSDADVDDGGTRDAARGDAGMPEPAADAGLPDAGLPDAGPPDAGLPDAGLPDAGAGPACTVTQVDCDGRADNGCEANLQSSATHCGGCGRSCTATQACDEGTCAVWPFGDWEITTDLRDAEFESVATDPATGDLYLAGAVRRPWTLGAENLAPVTRDDAFVARLTDDGTVLWAVAFDSGYSDRVVDLAFDPAGAVYLAVTYLDSTKTPFEWRSQVLAFSETGARLWNQEVIANLKTVTSTTSGVVAGGYFLGSVDLGAGATTVPEGRGFWLASYARTGAYRWSRVQGTADRSIVEDVVSTGSTVLATGYVVGTTSLGGPVRSAGSDENAFVAAYADPGGAHLWDRVFESELETHGLHLAVSGPDLWVGVRCRERDCNLGGADLTGSMAAVASYLVTDGSHRWSTTLPGSDTGPVAMVDGSLWAQSGQFLTQLDPSNGDERRRATRRDPGVQREGVDIAGGGTQLFVVETTPNTLALRGLRTR